MGITIHFEGKLKDSAGHDACLQSAKQFCAMHGWSWVPIDQALQTLSRVYGDVDSEYVGPVSGIEIRPHADSEPFRLEFDQDLIVQEFTKTQFAPIEIHLRLVELLRLLAPHFAYLDVEDEGEYFETGDLSVLAAHRDSCSNALNDYLAGPEKCKGPIHLASGRIVDLVEYD